MSTGPATELAESTVQHPPLWRPRHWPIWETPGALLFSLLIVELTTLGVGVLALTWATLPTAWDLVATAVLTVGGLLATELARQAERMRIRTKLPHFIDLGSVWTFAAAIALPLPLALLAVIIMRYHLWWRTGRPRVPLYRSVFTTSTILLACAAASLIHAGASHQLVAPCGIVLALLVYTTINSALVAGAVAMSSPQPNLAMVLGSWDDHLIELATLSLGALSALAIQVNMWMVLLIGPPLFVLYRAVPIRHLQAAAEIDSKTGLLRADAWRARSEHQLERDHAAKRSAGLLVIDVDHFKHVNDTHGHLIGDQVLQAVAAAVQDQVRERDIVGRFGGEEFVVLLSTVGHSNPAMEVEAVAERIRIAVNQLQLTVATADGPLTVSHLSVSVGATLSPATGDMATLHDLLQAADNALFAAKRAGRNRVRFGRLEDTPRPRPIELPRHHG